MSRLSQAACALGVGLATALALVSGASAQIESTESHAQAVVVDLLRGRDVSANIVDLTVTPESGPDTVPALPTDRLASDITTALRRASTQARRLAVSREPSQKSSDGEALLASLSELRGQQMLVAYRAEQALQRVRSLPQSGAVLRRAEYAARRYQQLEQELGSYVTRVQSLLGDAGDSNADRKRWRDELTNLSKDLQAWTAQSAAARPPILRALPFDRPLLNPPALVTSPTITPSYAQAAPDPGGSPDLQTTAAAPLSNPILVKAAELGNDYVAIYEFVRGQIVTEYYAGSMKGAEATLRSGAGNDVDQASLLIALYRASNVPARYVHGVVRLPIEQAGEPLGLTDPNQILVALARAGIAHEPVIQGGQIGSVDMAQTWVSIFVPYANYRGVPVDLAGRLWLPLAPAVKGHSFDPGSNIAASSGLEGDTLVADYLANQIDDPPLTEVRSRVEAYLAANPALGSYAEQLPDLAVAASALKLLPASLPFETMAVTAESSELTDAHRQLLRLVVTDESGNIVMDDSVPVASLIDHRISFSYDPATVGDFNAIREFGGRTGVPAYLVRLRPVLKADGETLLAGQSDLAMGDSHSLSLEISSPAGTRSTSATLVAGSYAAINLSAQLGLPEPVDAAVALADDSEGRAARLLYNQAARYASQWDEAEGELAGLFDLAVIRPLPSLALVTTSVTVSTVQGLNDQLEFRGVNLDAALRNVEPVSRYGDLLAEVQWMRLAALQGSYLESSVFESQWSVPAISADKGLRLAVEQSLPVLEIDETNVGSVLPGLSHAQQVRDAVSNAVDQGYRVLIPEAEITLNAWTGSVWHSWDPELGSSGYFISGGLAGGSTTEPPEDWILQDLANVLGNPYGGEPNTDPNAAALVRIIPASDGQFGKAGEPLARPLAVLVTDVDGRPVSGATVRFDVLLGGDAQLGEGLDSGPSVEVETDSAGIGRMPVELGSSTANNPVYALLQPGNSEADQIAENWVAATVLRPDGSNLGTGGPFIFYTTPDDPIQLNLISSRTLGYPNGWVGPTLVRLEDQYGNPVANREIRYTADSAIASCDIYNGGTPALFFTGDECQVPFRPGTSSCGSSSISVTSTIFGPFVQIINGDGPSGARFPIRISSNGVPDIGIETRIPITLGTGPVVSEVVTLGAVGQIVDSASIGQIAPAPRYAQTFTAERAGEEDCLLEFSDGQGTVFWSVSEPLVDPITGEVIGSTPVGTAPGELIGPEYYQGFLPVGPQPVPDSTTLVLSGVDLGDGPVDINAIRSFITAVDAQILSVQPEPVRLNINGISVDPITVSYSVQPETFPISLQINLLEDGNVIDFRFQREADNVGTVSFAPGKELDVEKTYVVQALINPGSVFEIVTELFPVALTEPIVKSVINFSGGGGGAVVGNRVRPSLRFFNDIDIPNERVCRKQDIVIELTQSASVSMEFERLDVAGDPNGQIVEILDRESFPEGTHSVEISADDLGTDSYVWRIVATSLLDGRTDGVTGSATSSFIQRNSLPIAHPTVRGVDLATGKMVTAFRDFEIPGLGNHLRFTRSYSSAVRSEPGELGAGWKHNYSSRVVRSNCGDYYVIGGDVGTVRFVEESGGFRALKGYHGTLQREPSDGSFLFYSLSGNRFHYVQQQDDAWWLESITDPNGNMTSLSYEPDPDRPKLVSVTDASERQINFTYEKRNFRFWSGNVITAVSGPGGISMSFQYDEFGNQTSASREEGAFSHTYEYSTDTNFANANLLIAQVDEVFAARREYEYAAVEFSVPISGSTLDVLSSNVLTITEPDGGRTRFAYQLGLWGMHEQAVVTDPRGNTTTYTMNDYGAATRIARPNGARSMTWETDVDVLMMSETDENDRVTSYSYDENGNAISTQVGGVSKSASFSDIGFIRVKPSSVTDFRGITSSLEYDDRGNLISESRGGSLSTHSYNSAGSRLSTTDPNGNTTTYSYDANGYLVRQIDAAGNTMEFTWDVRGRKLSETDGNGNTTFFSYDDRDRLTRTQFANGSVGEVIYSDQARQTTAIDPRGNTTVTTHDAMGRAISIRDAAGNTSNISYDLNGNKTSETDYEGRLTSFIYDGANRMVSSTEPEGRVSSFVLDPVGNLLSRTISGSGGSRTSTFIYEPDLYFQISENVAGLATTSRTYDEAGNIITETDPLGRVTTYTYDAFDRTLSQSGPLGSGFLFDYDSVGNLVTETTINSTSNQVRRYSYDAANRRFQSIDPEGGVVSNEHDGAGNLIRVVNERGKSTDYRYDSRNRRSELEDPLGMVTSYQYDGNDNLIVEIRPNGNVIQHTYDVLNRRTSTTDEIGAIISQSYDSVGNVLSRQDGNGNTTIFVYDGQNRESTVTRPGGRTTSNQFNVFGELTAETDPDGNTIQHSYNALAQRISTTGPNAFSHSYSLDLVGNVLTETDSLSRTTTMTYDDLNNMVQLSDSIYAQTFTYDLVANRIGLVNQRGVLSEWSYDRNNRMTQFSSAGQVQETREYDLAGNLLFQSDANGNVSGFEYDDRDQLIQENRPLLARTIMTRDSVGDVIAELQPAGRTLQMQYDLRRRLVEQTDGFGLTTRYSYDLNNNKLSVSKPLSSWTYEYDAADRLTAATNSLDQRTEYSYDARSNRVGIIDASGRATSFDYDARNRMIEKTFPDSATLSLAYDDHGNLISRSEPNGTAVTIQYDDLDREVSRTSNSSGGVISESRSYDGKSNLLTVQETLDSGGGGATIRTYDDLDRLISVRNRHGQVLQYQYDANGNRTALLDHNGQITHYTFDALNRLSNVAVPGLGTFDYSYLANGLVDRISYPNGAASQFSYDLANRISQISNTQGGESLIEFRYTYDANNNRLSQEQEVEGATERIEYSYDGADRLREVRYPDRTVQYMLDSVGNRTSELVTLTADGSTVLRELSYNNRDQLSDLIDSNGPDIAFSYDANGNLISRNSSTNMTFSYSPRNRLVEIQTDAISTVRFEYNFEGLRMARDSGGERVEYVYDESAQIAQTNTLGNTLRRFHYGSERRLASTTGTNNGFVLHDALRSPVVITDQSGALLYRAGYDAWGEVTEQTGSATFSFGFTGMELDNETGLYHAGARYYDPKIGRFLSEDPLEGNQDDPPSLHRYLYAKANPALYVDPDGLAGYFFDGTDQDMFDEDTVNPSNVGKLYNLYEGLKFYQPGVGTNDGADNFFGSASGLGGDRRLERAYRDLVFAYNGKKYVDGKLIDVEPDRDIDIVGFSRGAALGRAFANIVNERGIPNLNSEASIVSTGHGRSRRFKRVYAETFASPEIRFMGIYDTVGSFGMAGDADEGDKDLSIAPNVRNVRHAVAKDELRHFFPLTSAIDPTNPRDPRIVEIVFQGVHSDIGGSYKDDDSLSHDALYWMYQEAAAAGVPLEAFPQNQLPVLPSNAVPPTRTRYVRRGQEFWISRPNQGGRTQHDSRYIYNDTPRNVFYLRNRRRPGDLGDEKPRKVDTVTGPKHFKNLEVWFDDPYWIVTEDYQEP